MAPAGVVVRQDLRRRHGQRSLNCKEVSHKKMAGKTIPWRRRRGPPPSPNLSKSEEERGGQCVCREHAVRER